MDVFSLRLREESIGIWEIRVYWNLEERVGKLHKLWMFYYYERRKFRVGF